MNLDIVADDGAGTDHDILADPAVPADLRPAEQVAEVPDLRSRADLDAFVEHMGEIGATVDERQETPDGDFAWLDDPEGNRIELVQAREG